MDDVEDIQTAIVTVNNNFNYGNMWLTQDQAGAGGGEGWGRVRLN